MRTHYVARLMNAPYTLNVLSPGVSGKSEHFMEIDVLMIPETKLDSSFWQREFSMDN